MVNQDVSKDPTQLASEPPPHPHGHHLILSTHMRTDTILDRVAGWVSVFVGSMWTFVFVTLIIVVWLFAGNVVGFDKTPWPLLLTVLNLPQLSIMISLQVSANLAEKTSDARAAADHQTLVSLYHINQQQLEILHGQQEILDRIAKLGGRGAAGGPDPGGSSAVT